MASHWMGIFFSDLRMPQAMRRKRLAFNDTTALICRKKVPIKTRSFGHRLQLQIILLVRPTNANKVWNFHAFSNLLLTSKITSGCKSVLHWKIACNYFISSFPKMTVKSNPYEWSKFIPLAKNSQKSHLFYLFGELCNV